MCKNVSVADSYDKLIRKQQKLMDKMSNLGRMKDYKVQKIEKKYQLNIDDLIRKQQSLALKIEIAKRYVANVDNDENPVIMSVKRSKTTRKK